jgi:hypothetical protein
LIFLVNEFASFQRGKAGGRVPLNQLLQLVHIAVARHLPQRLTCEEKEKEKKKKKKDGFPF